MTDEELKGVREEIELEKHEFDKMIEYIRGGKIVAERNWKHN